MKTPELPRNEERRLETLRSLHILDTHAEERFDRLTKAATALFEVPIALVSLVDTDRQWFKSCVGLDVQQTSRDISFCGHAILGSQPLVVCDAIADERFADNPLVTGNPDIRAYAGVPLRAPNGQKLGTFCIIDRKPRSFNAKDLNALIEIARLAEIELSGARSGLIDSVTGLLNYRGFSTAGQSVLNICALRQLPAKLVTLQINIKSKTESLNESFQNDRMLSAISDALALSCRELDLCGQLGSAFTG